MHTLPCPRCNVPIPGAPPFPPRCPHCAGSLMVEGRETKDAVFEQLKGYLTSLRDVLQADAKAFLGSEGEPHPPASAIGPGSQVGSFVVEETLGVGAICRFFKARHTGTHQTVVIKMLRDDFADPREGTARLFQEARLVNTIGDPHIAQIFDINPSKDGAYVAMEFLAGRSLRDTLTGGVGDRLSLPRYLRIMIQVCDAMSRVHRWGTVHRNLKPANIFLTTHEGQADYVKLLDFSLARRTDVPIMTPPPGARLIGTPRYMSPEQTVWGPIDARTDIWAAGVVLYEILAGRCPFEGRESELAEEIRNAPTPRLPELTLRDERIAPEVAAATFKCLEKAPEERFASMKVLAEALAPFAAG
jgi:serine/threonine protein kinase